MARPVKPNHPVSVRLEQGLYNQLNQFCEDSGQTKTVAIERALESYIRDYYKTQELIQKVKEK